MIAPPPTEGGEVAAALLVRGELFCGRVPRAEVRGQYQSLHKASEAVSNSKTCFSDPTLDRVLLHFFVFLTFPEMSGRGPEEPAWWNEGARLDITGHLSCGPPGRTLDIL